MISSTRIAWIVSVALLAEGVDRNTLQARTQSDELNVALLAEGVDRNLRQSKIIRQQRRRPPRGGRG